MKLSNSKKLSLAMLSDIYQQLNIQGQVDPRLVRAAIQTGNTWALTWEYACLQLEPERDQPREVDEVANILGMWDRLEQSYIELTLEQQEHVKDVTGCPQVRFQGFDGESEGNHLNIARFFADYMARGSYLKGRDLDARTPTLDANRRMFSAFKRMESLGDSQLTAMQIIDVLNA